MRLRELAWRAVNAVRTELHRAAERSEAPAPELPPAEIAQGSSGGRAPVGSGPATTGDAGSKPAPATVSDGETCLTCDAVTGTELLVCGPCLTAYKPAREAEKARKPRAKRTATPPSSTGEKT